MPYIVFSFLICCNTVFCYGQIENVKRPYAFFRPGDTLLAAQVPKNLNWYAVREINKETMQHPDFSGKKPPHIYLKPTTYTINEVKVSFHKKKVDDMDNPYGAYYEAEITPKAGYDFIIGLPHKLKADTITSDITPFNPDFSNTLTPGSTLLFIGSGDSCVSLAQLGSIEDSVYNEELKDYLEMGLCNTIIDRYRGVYYKHNTKELFTSRNAEPNCLLSDKKNVLYELDFFENTPSLLSEVIWYGDLDGDSLADFILKHPCKDKDCTEHDYQVILSHTIEEYVNTVSVITIVETKKSIR